MSLLRPRIHRFLIEDQGEHVVDEVRKYWAAFVFPWGEVALGGFLFLAGGAADGPLGALLGAIGVLAGGHGTWRVIGQYRDVFVITNMRVFRVHGILTQQIATMPLTRILDVSVFKPFIGRLLGYGNFIFESAAQAQGLREIRYVGNPDRRGLTIQRVITEAGLRGFVSADTGVRMESGPPPVPDSPPGAEADQRELAYLLTALRREHERLAAERPRPPRDPDATDTAELDVPRR